MEKRALGNQGLKVSSLGLGTMGMTAFYGDFNPVDEEENHIQTIGKALELGLNFLDTAWVYQRALDGKVFYNEELVGKALKRFGRENFIVATKFGIGFQDGVRVISGKPEFIRQQLSESLQRLQIDYIDLYYMHRMDPSTPIEETMQCLKELVEEGKIKYIGLSECTPNELRRAYSVYPVSAIQMEWSLNTRDLEETVIPVARELNVGIVAYSPLGRGLLTGTITSLDSLSENDWRRTNPRFQSENIQQNIANDFFGFAKSKNCTPAQLALAWVLAQGDDVVPIPGTKTIARIIENAGATSIKLTPEERTQIELLVPKMVGGRYDAQQSAASFNNRL